MNGRRLLLFAAGLLVVLLAVFALRTQKRTDADFHDPRDTNGETAPRRHVVFVDLMANGSPAPSLTRDFPVVLTASIDNPDPDRSASLKGMALLKPRVRPADSEKDLALTWAAPELHDVEVPAGSTVWVTWILEESLAVGFYRVDIEGADALVDGKGGNSLLVRTEFMPLEVIEGEADPARLAAIKRRLILLRGDAPGYLEAVRQALHEQPHSHELRFQLVEALDLNGHSEEAAHELAELIADVEERFGKEHPEQTPHLPSWYYAYLRTLSRKAPDSRGP